MLGFLYTDRVLDSKLFGVYLLVEVLVIQRGRFSGGWHSHEHCNLRHQDPDPLLILAALSSLSDDRSDHSYGTVPPGEYLQQFKQYINIRHVYFENQYLISTAGKGIALYRSPLSWVRCKVSEQSNKNTRFNCAYKGTRTDVMGRIFNKPSTKIK